MKIEKLSIYKIESNDSLSSLAEKFNINPTEILICNNISPKQIFEGKYIKMPKI